MRKTIGLTAAALLTSTLVACSGDDSGDYCDALDSAKTRFESIDFTTMGGDSFDELRNKISELHDSAPDEVADDWATLQDMFDGFDDILADAGIGFDDLEKMQQGQIPEGLDLSKLQDLGDRIDEIANSDDLDKATKAIADHAKDECGIDINSDTGSGS